MTSKRQLLINTAFQLFYRKGVHAVGINEILAESGVAKKTLYNHFSSKEELLLATLQYRDDIYSQWLTEELKKAADGKAKIDALFNALDDWFNNRTEVLSPFYGCFFINVSAEYGELETPMHQHCARHKSRIEHIIRQLVTSIKTDPAVIVQLTQALCLLKEGAIVQAYVQGDKQAAIKAHQTALLLLEN